MTEHEKIKFAMREYKRKWRERNPGKEREYNRKYWLKKAEEMECDENVAPNENN